MRHLDVAGGTGDVARRVRNAIDQACEDSAKHAHDDVLQVCSKAGNKILWCKQHWSAQPNLVKQKAWLV